MLMSEMTSVPSKPVTVRYAESDYWEGVLGVT